MMGWHQLSSALVEHEAVVDHHLAGRVVQLSEVVCSSEHYLALVSSIQLVSVDKPVFLLLEHGKQLVQLALALQQGVN
jgi:hypothetical protein